MAEINQPLPDLSNPSPEDTVNWIVRQRQSAQGSMLAGLDANPDDAARAHELSNATGVPAPIINGDLENFEKQHKAAVASEIIKKNQFLQDYINAHPLAANVSNDDWGNLDDLSHAYQRLSGSSILEKFNQGYREGFGAEPFGTYFWGPGTYEQIQTSNAARLLASAVSVIGAPIEFGLRVPSALISGVTQAGAQAYKQVTGEDVSDHAAGMLQVLSDPGMAMIPGVGELFGQLHENLAKNAELKQQVNSAIKFIQEGKVPPVGVSQLTDQIHAEQAKIDGKNLDEVLKIAGKSSTGERSPELLNAFLKLHQDAKVGISGDAVRELYGDKVPAPDDNILGWVPGIQEQMALAEATGGDVEIPLADWVSRVDPGVAKELHDNLRLRPGGMTIEEAKELPARAKEIEPEAANENKVGGYTIQEDDKGFIYKDNMTFARFDTRAEAESYGREVSEQSKYDFAVRKQKQQTADITSINILRSSAKLDEPSAMSALRARPSLEPTSIIPDKFETGLPVESNVARVPSQASFKLSDIIDKIDYSHLGSSEKLFSQFFGNRLKEQVGDTPVHVIDQDQMAKLLPDKPKTPGFFFKGNIVLRKDMVDGTMPGWITSHVIAHEAAHALSVDALYNFPDLKSAVTQLKNETHEFLKRVSPDARKEHSYAFGDEREFLAEGYGNPEFRKLLSHIPISKELSEKLSLGKKTGSIWDAMKGIFKELLSRVIGKTPSNTVMDAFFKIGEALEHANKILAEMDEEPAKVKEIEPELPQAGTTNIEDREIFKQAAAMGLTKKSYLRYQELIEKRKAEDAEAFKKEAEARERERQTQEWKENYDRVRGEVENNVRARPDIAADRFLREGDLYGQKVRAPKIARDTVPSELRVGSVKDHLADDGIHADDMAGLFGYQSGDSLVRALNALGEERDREGLTPRAHTSRLVDAETDREMRKTYGNLEDNVLEAAKDHVFSPTQFDLLHEETLEMATRAGAEFSFTQAQIKQWVKEQFDKTPISGHSSDKYLAAAGRAGQRAENALLEGDPAEAFRSKQQQYFSTLLGKEARKLEKERASFDKLAKRYSRREIPSIPGEFANWIHDILMRTGHLVRRTVQDLQEQIGRETDSTLEKFTQAKNNNRSIWEETENMPSDFQVMPVAPFLFDPAYRRPISEMTPGEFRAVRDSIKTIAKNGAEDRKIDVQGTKEEFDKVRDKMVSQIEELFGGKEKQYAFGHKDEGVGHALRTYWASLLQVESVFNRFDKGNPDGIFKKVVTEPLFEGSNGLNTLERVYSRKYRAAIPKFKDLDKKVDNPIFKDPLYDGELKQMTRGNLLAVLQNVGNPSQLDKLARGYEIKDKGSIMTWLFSHTTKEDWDRAQRIGDLFEEAFEESARMYHSLSGVAPEKIDLQPIQTPFGEYRGWYHPIVYDPIRPGQSKKLMGPSPLEDGAYYRVATPAGYTKKRTGYAAPIQLNFDAIPWKLHQMLNDAAMRPAVTNAAKVFYDPKFQMAVTKYYGKEIKDLFIPYLKDVAGQKQFKDAAQTTALKTLEFFRQNVIGTLIGFNPTTVMKHLPTAAMLSIKEVGAGNFFRELSGLLSMNDELGEKNWTFAMHGGMVNGKKWNGSEELQRRQRNWQETLSGTQQDLFGESSLRNTVIKYGATPVAISDLLSAVPTWLAAYKDQIRAGEQHGVAVQFADRAVRRAHGSSAITARPRIMRGGPLAQLATPFYTFFNEMFQRQYEMAWRAKDALGEFKEGEYKAGLKEVPNLMKGLWAYVVFPALIEQAVSPIITKEEPDSVKALEYGIRTIGSSLPILRDVIEAFLGGRDPTVGLYSTGAKMLVDMGRDIGKGKVALDRQHAGTTIKHAVTAFGAVSGLTNAQEGRTGEYVWNYATGVEKPRDIGDILRGLKTGTQKEIKR